MSQVPPPPPLRPSKIGDVQVDCPVVLAPMTGVTDLPFRRLVRRYGSGLNVTEMIASEAAIRETRQSVQKAAWHASEDPVSMQLVGCDPNSMAEAATGEKLSVTVTGNQWWWDIVYNSNDASKTLRTANELHLPLGVPTRILLPSNDVIHSFWVPSLAGKQDLIPGRENDITIVPKTAGIFRGQCAEFCGAQHAHMALVVVVESYPDFIKWWHHQLQPAPAPNNPLTLAGYKYVTTGPCSACHNIGGTPASGQVAPDLTHLASRKSLAAGTMPMSRGNLYGWVEDPQSLKPGVRMPTIGMEPNELHAVVAYLETLK